MRFKKEQTKREKKIASRKRLGIFLIIIGLVVVNILLIYSAFFEKSEPILSPLSKNQISTTQVVKKKLEDLRIRHTSFTTERDLSYKIIMDGGTEVILDQDKDIGEQLSSLQLILKQLKIEGKTLKRLDFRYQKPIITF